MVTGSMLRWSVPAASRTSAYSRARSSACAADDAKAKAMSRSSCGNGRGSLKCSEMKPKGSPEVASGSTALAANPSES